MYFFNVNKVKIYVTVLIIICLLNGCFSNLNSEYSDSASSTVFGYMNSSSYSYNLNFHQNCPFCLMVAGKEKCRLLFEDEDIFVIEKKHVHKPVNCLIIPKKHIVNIKDLDSNSNYDSEIGAKIFKVAQKMSHKLESSGDFTLTMNNGARSAQSVFHMHAHFRSPFNWKDNAFIQK